VREPVLRWLLTYLVHSTVLLAAACLLGAFLRERRLVLQEAVLRAALLGGFVTAGLQLGLDLRPVAGALAVPAEGRLAEAPAARPLVPAEAPGWEAGPVAEPGAPAWAAAALDSAARSWPKGLALAWAGLAGLALARLAVAASRLRRLLRDRRPIAEGELAPETRAIAPALGLRRVRLSAVRRLPVPLARGVLWPEVCLPARALASLGPDEQAALCAHELAHVARRDPAWLLLARLAEAVAPVQPLNVWARRRLQDVAECLSDDLAVAASGRPLGLARSLVDVASWTVGERPDLPGPAVGALSARSRLGHRVERLMDPFRALERPRRLLLPAAALVVLATAFVSPVVSGSAQEQTPAPGAEAAPEGRPAPMDEARSAEAKARLEAISRTLEERARRHEAGMKAFEAEMGEVAARIEPREADLQSLARDVEKAALAFAESVSADLEQASPGRSERTAEAARRLAEAQAKIHAAAREVRIPAEEMRALADKAREMARLVRPTEEELVEIRRLSREVSRDRAQQARDGAQQARDSAAQARDAVRIVRESLRQARESLRRVEE
jgi:beta-lactamase regulating signal transducer with metallopeptidase domain